MDQQKLWLPMAIVATISLAIMAFSSMVIAGVQGYSIMRLKAAEQQFSQNMEDAFDFSEMDSDS